MIIHSSDVDGNSLLSRLQMLFQTNDDEGDQREIKVNYWKINERLSFTSFEFYFNDKLITILSYKWPA